MARYLKLARLLLGQALLIAVPILLILLIVFKGMEGVYIALVLAWVLACPLICRRMAAAKGRSKSGAFLIGLVLGVFGVIVVWLLPDSIESRLRKEREFNKLYSDE